MRVSAVIFLLFCSMPVSAALQRLQLQDSLKISDVWSGHPVDFAFIARGDSQYVAYYDTARRMTVAVRGLRDKAFRHVNLPSVIGWDSHNYIALALDSAGYIHVSGNMHASALVYFRSTAPYAIDSLKSAAMVGSNESSVTYPVFIIGPSGQLIYFYRDGTSGNGNQIFNKWTMSTKQWSRLFNQALIDGQGQRNAYMGGPILGPDGYYHVFWMWRETPDAGTTHDVSYIRSKDLLNWENADGTKLSLPVTITSPGILVDSIPQNSGLINRGAIGFDSQDRLIITYHKYDATANHYTQLYNTRREGNRWKIYQTSQWAYQWVISGTGSLVLQITFGPVELQPDGSLTQSYYHVQYGTGIWELNETGLTPASTPIASMWPVGLEQAKRPGMEVHWLKCHGPVFAAGTFSNSTSSPDPDPSTVYALRWETMPENNDQPRDTIPAPTALMLYTFKDPNVTTHVVTDAPETRSGSHVSMIVSGGKKVLISLPRSMAAPGPVRLRVVDIRGKTIADRSVPACPCAWDCKNAAPGFYCVQVEAGAIVDRKGIFIGR